MSMKARFVAAEDGTPYRVLGSTMTVKAAAEETDGVFEVVVVDTSRGADVVAHRHPWAETVLRPRRAPRRPDRCPHPPRRARRLRRHPGSGRARLHGHHRHRSLPAPCRSDRSATEAFRGLDQRLPEPVAGPDDVPVMLDVAACHGIELVLPAAG